MKKQNQILTYCWNVWAVAPEKQIPGVTHFATINRGGPIPGNTPNNSLVATVEAPTAKEAILKALNIQK